MRMAVETMGGTAAYLAANDWDGPALRRRVATPGGATERGLIRLEEEGLGRVVRSAVEAVVEGTRR
jgi:pyrroline-5-carboxylate reductase